MAHLSHLPALRLVALTNTSVSDKGLDLLRKALPKIKIDAPTPLAATPKRLARHFFCAACRGIGISGLPSQRRGNLADGAQVGLQTMYHTPRDEPRVQTALRA